LKRQRKKDKKRAANEVQDDDVDPELAAVMGFGGFGK
jgi:hypothetical protein